jgi:hypothetical protein
LGECAALTRAGRATSLSQRERAGVRENGWHGFSRTEFHS